MTSNNSEPQEGEWYRIFLLGIFPKRDDGILQLLKAAKLREEAGDLSRESLLAALDRLNDACLQKLCHVKECRTVRSVTYEQVKKTINYEPYCEDPRLSMAESNKLYKGLYIDPETPVLSQEHRERLLACLCSYHALEDVEPRQSLALHAHWMAAVEAAQNWTAYGSAQPPSPAHAPP